MQIEDLKQFRQWKSRTPGHPENFETPGVEVTTGNQLTPPSFLLVGGTFCLVKEPVTSSSEHIDGASMI